MQSNWINSFHAGFLESIPGYTATVDSGYRPGYALSIANIVSVPEPDTYAMLLVGLGLLGFIGRRRKQQAG